MRSSRTHFQTAALALSLAVLLSSDSSVRAQEKLPNIRRIYVPADAPESWPEGDWTPIPAARLKRALRRTTDEPHPGAWIRYARYSAAFRDGTLQNGTFGIEIEAPTRSESGGTSLLSWENANFAFSNLQWEDQPAKLGTSLEDKTLLMVPHGQRKLSGDWSLRGRPLAYGFQFQLRLPPAAVSEVTLELPRAAEFVAFDQTQWEWLDSPSPNFRTVRLNLGSRTSVDFAVMQFDGSVPIVKTPSIFTHAYTLVVLSRDQSRIGQELNIEALEAPLQSVTFQLPEDVEIREVELGGRPLEGWSVSGAPGQKVLKINFPQPLTGLSRPLRLTGQWNHTPVEESVNQPLETSQEPLTIPRILPRDSYSLFESVTINVVPPFELLTVEEKGYRQTAATTTLDGSGLLSFDAISPECSIDVRIGLPPVRLRTELVTRLSGVNHRQTAFCELTAQVSSGRLNEINLELAAGWHPTSVALKRETEAEWFSGAHWWIAEQENLRMLRVELPRAVSRGQSVDLRMNFQQFPAETGSPLVPVVRTESRVPCDQLLVLKRDQMTPDRGASGLTGWSQIDLDEAPEWLEGTEIGGALNLGGAQWSLFAARSPAFTPLPDSSSTARFSARSEDRLVLKDDDSGRLELTESLSFQIEDVSAPLSTLNFSTASDAALNLWTWNVKDRPEVEVQCLRKTQPPNDNTGGRYWELAFVPPLTSPTLVTAQQSSSIRNDRVAAVLPLVENSQGRVVVENLVSGPLGSGLNVSSELLEQAVPSEQPLEASYTQAGAKLTIQLPDRRPAGQRTETSIHWETLFLSSTADLLLHHISVELPAEMTRVTGHWPAALGAPKAWINDVPLAVHLDESGRFQIDWDGSPQSKRLKLEFLSPADWRRSDYRWSISLPQFDLNLRQGTWSVRMPDDCRISDYSDSLSLIESYVSTPIHWSRRFFGPLGRRTRQEFFRPLDGEEWRSLLEPQNLQADPAVESATGTYRFRLSEWPSHVNLLGWSERRQERYAWVCYLLVLIAGVLIRVARWDSGPSIAAWCLALSGLTAWAAPESFSMFSGAVFAAVVTSVLIPRVLLLGRRGAVQEADTDLQFVEGSTLKGLVARLLLTGLILTAASQIAAQSTSRTEPRQQEGAKAAGTIDVLIPYANSEPSEQLPSFVYIRESDRQLPIFEEPASKLPVLFTFADYHCRLSESETPTIRVKYQAELPVQREISMLTIPLSGANLARAGACFVNGEEAPVAITPRGLLEIGLPAVISAGGEPADPEAPLRAPPPSGIDGSNAYRSQTIDIELNLYPPVTVQGSVQQWELQIPSISNSRFRCDYPRAAGWPVPRLEGSRGEVDRVRDGLITADLGKSTRISCRWSSTGFPETGERQRVQVDINPAVAVKLLPTHLEYRIQTRNAVSEGRVNSLSWHVPDDFHLHKVLSDEVVLQTHEVRISAEEKQITFDLAETLTSESSPCTIEAEFIVPLPTGPEDEIFVVVPDLFSSASDSPSSPELTGPSAIVGLWWPPELPLNVLETSSTSIRTLDDDEEWNELWSAEDASRLPTPERIYELQTPARLSFLRSATQPHKEAVGVHESGTIGDQYLDWEWTAEVETTRLPAFQYELQIEPRRLEIVSVSVLEGQSERVHRWSRGDSILTVRLTRKTLETPQQITIRGRVPLEADEELELPAIRLLGADRGESRVDLYLSPNRTAQWLADDSEPSASTPPASRLNRGDLTLFDSFTRSDDDAQQRKLRIGRKNPPPLFERVTTLRRRSDGDFDVSVMLTEETTSTRDAPLQVVIPAEWIPRLRPLSPIGEFVPELEPLAEGGARIEIPPESRSLTLVLQTTLSAPKESNWTVPWPGLRGDASYYDLVSLRLSDGWAPHVDCRFDPADGSEASSDSSDADRWGYLCDTLELQRTEISDPEAILTVMQLLATVELQPGEPPHGQWWILYRGRGQNSIALESPFALQDVTARINGRKGDVEYDPQSRLVKVPLLPGEAWQSCFVNWKSETPLTDTIISNFQLQMPKVIDLTVRDSQVILVTHPDLKLTLHHDLKPESSVEFRLKLLEAFQSLLENEEFRPENVPDELLILLTVLLSPTDESASAGGQPADSNTSLQATRLADLQQELRELLPRDRLEMSESDLRTLAASEELSLWEALLPGVVNRSERPDRDLIYFSIPKNPEDSKVWWISRQWYRAGIAVLIAIVLIPASLKIIQNRLANWAVRHGATVWLMVGLIWWSCLQLSEVGLFIAVAALIALLWESVVPRQVRS